MLILFFIHLIRSLQNGDLLIHYDFQKVSDNVVQDNSGNGHSATLINEVTITEMGRYKVLNLGNGAGHLDLGLKAGETYSKLQDFSISIYYRVHENSPLDSNGRFLWTFSTLESNEATNGIYTGYRLNAQRFATSTGGYDNEHGMELGSQSMKGKWIHVAYTQKGRVGKIFINGIEKLRNDDMPINSENFESAPTFNWIGRAAFSWDAYLINTLVYDVRLYNRELSQEEINNFAMLTFDLDNNYMFGNEGDRTQFNQSVIAAKETLSGSTSKYLQAAINNYQQLYSYGELLLKSEKLSQPFLDYLCSQFDQLRNELINSENVKIDDYKIVSGNYDTNKGFIHPGGFHTEEDFERVRAQIEEGNEKVVQAFNILKGSEWSQSNCATWPVEVIIRGEGAQNYINAARGAHIAYQNALRWKLEKNDDFARHGVDVLMAWARVCKAVSGNSNWALAAGIYGYEFAQAAEILRTYDGWSKEDFEFFKNWMVKVWALPVYSFLSGRLGTWENSRYIPGVGHGTDGQRPGHYWSNWGLCNVLALQAIGLLCDDVFLYNQAMSYYKYDQTTQANWNTDVDLYNRGTMEYIDNLVPHVSEYEAEKNAYGKIGQMQESGRDQGHATFSVGEAVDICLTAWNQGDDLFSYHDNRLAAGIEFIAAYNNGGVDDLPFVTYHYATCGTAWHNAQVHTGPSGAARGQTRPYWGKIIGHYEGIKGVTLPYSDMAYAAMGIDGGCYGGTSGAYDHFGFSVLMNTRSGTATETQKPTLLTPKIEYDGQTIDHNELGGLSNTFYFMKNKGFPRGKTVKLMPQLPDGATDTGKWSWNTGQTTKDITIVTEKSFAYRATYTNENNVKSYQVFTLAIDGDCIPSETSASAFVNNEPRDYTQPIVALFGDKITLQIFGNGEWGSFIIWDNGKENFEQVFTAMEDTVVTGRYVNHCGATNLYTFTIKITKYEDHIYINNNDLHDKTTHLVNFGDKILIKPVMSANVPTKFTWSDGSSINYFSIPQIQSTTNVKMQIESPDQALSKNKDYRFIVIGNKEYELSTGYYVIKDLQSGKVLTNNKEGSVSFQDPKIINEKYDASQIWNVKQEQNNNNLRYVFSSSTTSNKYLNNNGNANSESPYQFQIWNAVGTNELMIYDNNKEYLWVVDKDGNVKMNESKELYGYPFNFIQCEKPNNAAGKSGKTKNKGGMIAGIVIGLIAAIAIAAVVVFLVIKRRRNPHLVSSEFQLVM